MLVFAAAVAFRVRSKLPVSIDGRGLRLGATRLARGELVDCALVNGCIVIRTSTGTHRWGPFADAPAVVIGVFEQIQAQLPTAREREEEQQARSVIQRHQAELSDRRKGG